MLQRKSRLLLILILLFSPFLLSGKSDTTNQSISYWLWAGITANDAPANSELYVLQGHIKSEQGKTSFERLGLYPHPIKSSKLFLVYRLEKQLPDAKDVIEIFQRSVKQWQRHHVTVTGMQLDFDSPTSKLLEYSHFLEDVRQELPEEYALSITGLGEWATNGSDEAMRNISSVTNEIVFQLYQGRQPLPDIETYIHALTNYPLPFRVGLLSGTSAPDLVTTLKSNSQYHGIIYFIQK